MLEAASTGAKVLHDRSVNLAKKFNLDLRVKNSQNLKVGTKISDISYEKTNLSIMSNIDSLSKISIIGSMLISNNLLFDIFNITKRENIKIENLSFSETTISLIVKTESSERLMNLLNEELV